MKYLARFIMWLAGWKYKGELPAEKKAVIISVPHTSNWDFFWGRTGFLSQGIPAYFDEEGIFFSARDDSAGIECDTGGSR
ncbi:MAG: hypothetical protein ACLU30_17095 [Odoribacter splanchnicus]